MNNLIVRNILRNSIAIFSLLIAIQSKGQTSEPKIISPYDSIELSNIRASGDKQSGNITISIDFKNNYSKAGQFTISCSVFGDFGITDTLGNKYKVFSFSKFQNPNMGYKKIASVRFGDKSPNDFNLMQIPFQPGEKKTLIFKLETVDKKVNYITDVHVDVEFTLDLIHVVAKSSMFSVKDIQVNWQ